MMGTTILIMRKFVIFKDSPGVFVLKDLNVSVVKTALLVSHVSSSQLDVLAASKTALEDVSKTFASAYCVYLLRSHSVLSRKGKL